MAPKFINKFEFARVKLIKHTYEILLKIKKNKYSLHDLQESSGVFNAEEREKNPYLLCVHVVGHLNPLCLVNCLDVFHVHVIVILSFFCVIWSP
jgi:hypothetical protein